MWRGRRAVGGYGYRPVVVECRGRVKEAWLRLAAAGRAAIAPDVDEQERSRRRDEQVAALRRARSLVDLEALLSDSAWR